MILLLILQLMSAHEPVVKDVSEYTLDSFEAVACTPETCSDTVESTTIWPGPMGSETGPISIWPAPIGMCMRDDYVIINSTGDLECFDPGVVRFKQIIQCEDTLCALDEDGRVWIYSRDANSIACITPGNGCIDHPNPGWIKHSENPTKESK